MGQSASLDTGAGIRILMSVIDILEFEPLIVTKPVL